MSHFYVTASGSAAGEASRTGTKTSGIRSHTKGWHLGVEVLGKVEGEEDVFYVFSTHGSSRKGRLRLGTVRLVHGKPEFTPVGEGS